MKQNRRDVLKLAIGFTVFGAGLGGVVKFDPLENIKIGKLRGSIGVAEAEARCGQAYSCSGGGGQCGQAYECGGGGGKCGQAYECGGGGGKCGQAYDCAGT